MEASGEIAVPQAASRPADGWLAAALWQIEGATPVLLPPDVTVSHAAAAMRAASSSAAVIESDPLGIVTDSDLRSRVLAEGRGADTPVRDVMTRLVRTIDADQPAFAALLLMLEEGVHHVPVMRDGRVIAMVTDADLLRHQDSHPLLVLERVRRADRMEALRGFRGELIEAARGLARQGVDALSVAKVVAGLNDALASRVLRLAEQELEPSMARPPTPYALLLLGSAGRMEPSLASDLDSAIAYLGGDDEVAVYFAALADRLVHGIHLAGFPACAGGYEADRWTRPLDQWQETFHRWLAAPVPEVLVEAEVFLDLRKADGDLDVKVLEDALVRAAADRPRLLIQLARAAVAFAPPLGLFGRLRTKSGRVDLKRGGLAPLVLLARLYGLSVGSGARATPERLAAAAAAGALTQATADELTDAFAFLTDLRLRAQLADLEAGREAVNEIRLAELSMFEQRSLQEAFRAISRAQRSVQTRWMTDTVS